MILVVLCHLVDDLVELEDTEEVHDETTVDFAAADDRRPSDSQPRKCEGDDKGRRCARL